MARSDITNFAVEILEGPNQLLVIELSGRELPFRAGAGGSVGFGKSMRSKLTWYPGNRVASQQIIGPTLKPTTINGVWRDRYLGTDRAIQLVELFEELLDTGVQVRVNWSTIERQGIVKDFDWQPGAPVGGLSDIAWTCTFEWSAAAAPPPRRISEGDLTLRDSLANVASSISGLGSDIGDVVSASSSFVGLVSRPFETSRTALKDLQADLVPPRETLVQTAGRLGSEPVLSARFVEDASTAAGSAQSIAGQVAEVVSAIYPFERVVQDALEDVLGEAIARYDLAAQALEVAREAYAQRLRLEEIIRPAEFATITAVPGSDLRELAIRFYGAADLWDRIAQQNGLDSSRIPEDLDQIVIPLSLPDATDRKASC